MPLQIRRGTTAERLSITPVPGELIYDTDVGTIYVGDGTTPGGVNALIAGVLTTEEAVDAVAAALLLGQNQNITFSYNAQADFDNRIDAAVDLSNYSGTISATAYKGQVLAADNSVVYNPVTKEISAGPVSSTLITAQGNVIPGANATHDLGTSLLRFRELYLSSSGISLGDASITSTGTAINLPQGSTVGGTPIGTGIGTGIGDGVVEGANYKINIVSQDFSTIMVNSQTGQFIGDLTGDVTGDVTANAVTTNQLAVESIRAIDSGQIYIPNSILVASDILTEGSFIGTLEGNSTGIQSNYNQINVDFLGSQSGGQINIDSVIRTTEDIFTTGTFVGDLSGSVIASTIQTSSLLSFTAEIPDLLTSSISSLDSADLIFVNRSIFQSDVIVDGDLSTSNLLINESFSIDDIIISNNILELSGEVTLDANGIGSRGVFTFKLENSLDVRQLIGDTGLSPFLSLIVSRGTFDSTAAVQADDELGGLLFKAFTDSSTEAIAGAIGVFVDTTAVIDGGDFVKSRVIISAASDTSQEIEDAFLLDSAGVATSNAFVANKFMQLPVYEDDSARTTAIPTPAKGMMVFMTAGTEPTVSNKPVIYNGSGWEAF